MSAPAQGAGRRSDRDIILSSLKQPEDFEAVFDRHATMLFRYLRRRLGAELAEDLTAETLTRAFRNRHRFDCRAESALPWLHGIAANLVRMHRRTEERRLRAYARAAEPGYEASPSNESDRRIDATGQRVALASALADLPVSQREVLLLHAWADLTHEEIGEALGISPGAARSRLHRARAAIAKRPVTGNKTGETSIVNAP